MQSNQSLFFFPLIPQVDNFVLFNHNSFLVGSIFFPSYSFNKTFSFLRRVDLLHNLNSFLKPFSQYHYSPSLDSFLSFHSFPSPLIPIINNILSFDSNSSPLIDLYYNNIQLFDVGFFVDIHNFSSYLFFLQYIDDSFISFYPLFLGNVSNNGSICWGHNLPTAMKSINCIPSLFNLYLKSIFTLEGNYPILLDSSLLHYSSSSFLHYPFKLKDFSSIRPSLISFDFIKLPKFDQQFLYSITLIWKIQSR